MKLEGVLHRIMALGAQPRYAGDVRSLLHAYVACLSFSDLCAAIALSLSAPPDVRLALRGRLLRLIGETPTTRQRNLLMTLIDTTTIAVDSDRNLRPSVDSLHSALIKHLLVPDQHAMLERWVNRGTRGAMARWLKATRETPELFDSSIALAYWRATREYRAAKSLAYQSSPSALGPIVGELAEHCAEGWIIAKAILRTDYRDEAAWDIVRARHPATFLYLCAQLQRPISDAEAFDLVFDCSSINRGLAIWAIGQKGGVAVLDRIRDSAEALLEKDIAELRASGRTD